MKTKTKIITTCIVLTALIVVAISCQKNSQNLSNETNVESNVSRHDITSRQTSGTTQTYYSTDLNGHYYKMNVTWNQSGAASIERTVITSNIPVSTDKLMFVEDGITIVNSVKGYRITEPQGKKYYYIAFAPSTPLFYVNGGTIEIYCQAECNDPNKTCTKKSSSYGGGVTITCPGDCNCRIVGQECPYMDTFRNWKPLDTESGGIIIEASDVVTIP